MESIEHMIADKVFIHSKMCLLVEVLQYMYGSYCANSPRGLTVKELKMVATRVANNARALSCKDQRKISRQLHSIDQRATNACLKNRPNDEQGMIKMVQQGATWDKKHTAKSGYSTSSKCDH